MVKGSGDYNMLAERHIQEAWRVVVNKKIRQWRIFNWKFMEHLAEF
jgi:hypothetical protein